MDILLSFYLENELSPCLKKQFEEHLSECDSCRSKFDIIKTVFTDMKNKACPNYVTNLEDDYKTIKHENIFSTKLSEYMDNELSGDENIKIKKYTITNKDARKELEDSYNIRRLMSDSYKKTKADAKQDYTKAILKRLELEEEAQAGFHPAINLLIIFTVTVLVITTMVILSLST
jgi:hypothetical protein